MMRYIAAVLLPTTGVTAAVDAWASTHSSAVVSRPHIRLFTADPSTDLTALFERARVARRAGHSVVIEFADGVYHPAETLVIGPPLSGTRVAPTILRAAPGAKPILSGGRALAALRWQDAGDGIVRTRYAGKPFAMVWAGAARLQRARYPNARPGLLSGTSADATSLARVARWRNPAGGIVHALHPSRWGGIDQRILGKAADGSLVLAPPVGNNRMAPPSAEQRYVENIREELDAPGEWYADTHTGWLYLKLAAGIDPEQTRFTASRLETVVRIAGAHDIRIEGIGIRETEPTFLKTTEPLLRSDWSFYRQGAVTIANAERITIRDGEFTELGGNAVVVSGYARNVAIRDNHIHAIGGSGIAFVGLPSAVRSPLFDYHATLPVGAIDRTPGPRSDAYPADSDATDNLIHDIGNYEKQSAGVEIAMAARITVSHNSIYRVPRAGINIGDGTWGGHRIVDNDVFATVLETGDHGAFNSWGRDRFWMADRQAMNARVAADPALPMLDAIAQTVLRHNRFQCDRGWDIDLDDGSSNYLIEDNVLLSGGLKLREGFRRIARNNLILNNGIHPHVWFADSGDVITHNIMSTGYQPVGMRHWGTLVDANLFPTDAALARARIGGTDAHSRAGDPLFVDPVRGDYRLSARSPARALGIRSVASDGFGVTSPRLRALAERPAIPRLTRDDATPGRTEALLGMTIKSVETLGEQSATGLSDRAGVLVVAVAPGSEAARAGLVAGDAIIAVAAGKGAARQPIPTLADLIAAYRGNRWRGGFTLETFHDQHAVDRVIAFAAPETP